MDKHTPDRWLALPPYRHITITTYGGWVDRADWCTPIDEREFQRRLRLCRGPQQGAPLPPLGDDGDPAVSPTARTSDPSTSHAAAAAVRGARAASQQQAIYAYLCTLGAVGATMEEVHDALGWFRQIATPRFRELRRLGLIADTGTVRVNKSGKRAIVWVAVVAGAGGADDAAAPA